MKHAVLVAPAILASASFAGHGVTESTGLFQVAPGSGITAVSAIGAPANPRLGGYDFGAIDVGSGQSLVLSNWAFTNFASNDGFASNDYLDAQSVASLVITIKSGGTTVSSGTYSLAQAAVNGNSRSWNLVPASQGLDLTTGLSAGNYTIEFSNTYTYTNMFISGSLRSATTSVSTASFSVVPAPGAAMLLALAGVASSRRRR